MRPHSLGAKHTERQRAGQRFVVLPSFRSIAKNRFGPYNAAYL